MQEEEPAAAASVRPKGARLGMARRPDATAPTAVPSLLRGGEQWG